MAALRQGNLFLGETLDSVSNNIDTCPIIVRYRAQGKICTELKKPYLFRHWRSIPKPPLYMNPPITDERDTEPRLFYQYLAFRI